MEEVGKLEAVYIEGYEQGFSDGYQAAIDFLVNNPTAFKRISKDLYREQIA
jgi:hypothetical protein